VITADGLLNPSEIEKLTKNTGFQYNRFNFIITNPPFGSSIRKSEKAYLSSYDFGKKDPDWFDTKGKTIIEKRENQSTEILFIEQCHNYLAEGGYLGIVLPDGILTNSSLQYVRDGIEDKFRIVAVVSMPQTAFAATGAGVKSSLLFLKKYSNARTEKLSNQKAAIQIRLKDQFNYHGQLEAWEKEKAKKLKELTGLEYSGAISIAELKKTDEYKVWKD
jgi:type I restriction enzyme M protein